MAKHARLSASGSKQWINCPGSIRKEQDYPRGASSVFAMQGTAAHSLADYCLTKGTEADDYLGNHLWVYDGDDVTKKDVIAVPAKQQGGAFEERLVDDGYTCFTVVDGEGNGDLSEVKCWAVMMFVNTVRKELELSELLGSVMPKLVAEKYMDGSWLHPLMGGTADSNFLGHDNYIKLFDLKFGAGVVVEVEDNTQLKIYSILILKDFPDADGVDMYIVQPRLEHKDGPIRHRRYSRKELLDFQAELKDLADQTQKRNAPINAGEWCLWCKAKVDCNEFKAEAQRRAKVDFDDDPDTIPAPVDLGELARLAEWAPMLDALVKEVHGAIGRHLQQGRKVPGWKLVRQKTNRRFGTKDGETIPEEEIVRLMKAEAMVSEADLYHPRKLLTLAQMEKLGKDAKQAIKSVTFKPEGRLTVVSSGDPREEVVVDPGTAFPDDDDDAMELPG